MKKEILLVSAHQEFQLLLGSFLSRYYVVRTADNNNEALGLLEEGFRPHLIIGDTIIPSSVNIDLINSVKSKPELKNTPIIIMSGNEKASVKKELLQAGATDYLKKPFSLTELEKRINNVLEMSMRSH